MDEIARALNGNPMERAAVAGALAFLLVQIVKQAAWFKVADWRPQLAALVLAVGINLLSESRQTTPDWVYAGLLGLGSGLLAIGVHQVAKPGLARLRGSS